jgi:GDP-L-fucose synthase
MNDYVAGHRGMVGAALVRRLASEQCRILTVDRTVVDLTSQTDTERYPRLSSRRRAQTSFPRLLVHLSQIAPQPMKEEMLLTGPLEPTNQWYAVAKIAGIKLVEAYRQQYGSDFLSVMPTNLCGPGDNCHPEHSHVPAALIRRMHDAKISGASTVTIWGTGQARREFLAVDDLADACIFVLKHYSGTKFLNVGAGRDISIGEFAQLVADVVGYRGRFVFDTSRPDGAPQKLLDVSELPRLGWHATTRLRDGLAAAYADFLLNAGQRKLQENLTMNG